MNELEFYKEFFRVTDKYEDYDSWFWRVDKQGNVKLMVNCSDFFDWGCADAEDITPENLHLLEQAYIDCDATTDDEYNVVYGNTLFAARARKMRPQKPCYKGWSPQLVELFNQCGPERTDA